MKFRLGNSFGDSEGLKKNIGNPRLHPLRLVESDRSARHTGQSLASSSRDSCDVTDVYWIELLRRTRN